MKRDLQGKRFVVVGLGRSGFGAARLLRRVGALVTGNDQNNSSELRRQLEEIGVDACLGHHPEELFLRADCIVVSPGVPPLSELQTAAARGVPVVSEVELASWFVESEIVAITGTNGKSTVTSLVGEMLTRHAARPVFVGGNLGTPLTDVAFTDAAAAGGVVVVELSSFQLERIHDFRAHIGVVLNVTDDHLDRYDSFDAYAATKGRIFENQEAADHAVALFGEGREAAMARASAGQAHFFGGRGEIRVEQDAVIDEVSGLSVPISELSLRGQHNVLNACAAMLIARLAGAGPDAIDCVLRSFRGLPHRMELVRQLDGVDWLNDSKATNVGAAVASVEGAPGDRVVLIAGGVDKGGSYEPLAKQLSLRGRAVVLVGAAAPLIANALKSTAVPVVQAETMEAAVEAARIHAAPGDSVLLAPACSSYDMFANYKERGDRFRSAVASLVGRMPSAGGGSSEGMKEAAR